MGASARARGMAHSPAVPSRTRRRRIWHTRCIVIMSVTRFVAAERGLNMKQQRLSILALGSKVAEALSTRPPKGATFVGLVGAAAVATMGLSGIAVAQTGQGLE